MYFEDYSPILDWVPNFASRTNRRIRYSIDYLVSGSPVLGSAGKEVRNHGCPLDPESSGHRGIGGGWVEAGRIYF